MLKFKNLLSKCDAFVKRFSCLRCQRAKGQIPSNGNKAPIVPIVAVPDTLEPVVCAVCRKCDGRFDSRHFNAKTCLRHTGQLAPNWYCGFWDDTDLDVDTPYMRGIYPEGFEWTCCGQDGESKGCTADYHEADSEAWAGNSQKLGSKF
ncbi:uncharacterized protein J3D65DRAFT_391917 [Phyllosticta citribraziliensis]|uniref:Uncharacterized protein n=1 Tax=Phyllosticta citribraziliensis TaxID=989973 RepID=A0ABR1LKW9_9PEZI